MKKKFLVLIMLVGCLFSLSACGKTKLDFNNYIIEERNTLFTAQDELYSVTLSSGLREENYAIDGKVNNLVDFAVLTLIRNDSNPLANDTYTYIITINNEPYTGTLTKSAIDNSYVADLQINVPADAQVKAQIAFTGYSFDEDMENTSVGFNINSKKAIEIANKELSKTALNLTKNNGSKIEVVVKLLKDFSNSELKTYYWYVGAISTNGETLGILIDTNSGEVLAKKV